MLSCTRNSIATEDGFLFSKVLDFSEFDNFDCGNDDLNDFIRGDAARHQAELIAETYSFGYGEAPNLPLAFISLSNDTIRWRGSQIQMDTIPENLRYTELPAVKIGRLGVRREYQCKDVGTALINLVKELFRRDNRTGCRFMTVDAYNEQPVLRFYEKNGFDFYHDRDLSKRTRIMFFDLKTFVLPD
jgi:GNAT superfamily N-acetyltransferase